LAIVVVHLDDSVCRIRRQVGEADDFIALQRYVDSSRFGAIWIVYEHIGHLTIGRRRSHGIATVNLARETFNVGGDSTVIFRVSALITENGVAVTRWSIVPTSYVFVGGNARDVAIGRHG